ncbi:MAG TPA: putative baseplate assembly protein [Gemmatimonadales bacterium]|nr:putative baseplate assembly protein [Gemmatimonadales bacterium]
MPLPVPILDDRSYQQLRDELVRRIPVYAPEWTDYNASDPGITLLELFAFLGEHILFRFNQIPEQTRLAFLNLLKIPLRPARPAEALIAFERIDLDGAGVLVEQRSECLAGALSFETWGETVVWPVTSLAVVRAAAAPPSEPEAVEFATAAIDALGGLAPGEVPAWYENRFPPEDPSAAAAEALDASSAVDGALWIAVMSTRTTNLEDLRTGRLVGAGPGAATGGLLSIGFMPDEDVVSMDDCDACPGAGAAPRSDDMVWEVSTSRLVGGVPQYRRLTVEGDTTRGLAQRGVVRLRLPATATDLAVPRPADEYLEGTGVFPPGLADPELAAKVLFWLRATRRSNRPLGRYLWIGINAAEVEQARTARGEFLGTGTGDAGQQYELVHIPVLEGSVRLEVEEAGRWVPWTLVSGFEASREDDRHAVLDPEAGTIRFGNGVQGRAPQIGERIRVREYRYGGGPEGNVGPKAIAKPTGAVSARVKSANPMAATCGAAREPVAAALERIPGELRRRDRAVTSGDFRELALATPGVDLGRAECLPRFHPPTRFTSAAGVVSVVVWPREDRKRPNAPMPDRTTLRRVCAWLDDRRLVTTELYVIPPTYRRIAVAVGLRGKPGYGIEALRRWVELVLRQYLAPLPPYGPEGQGWPLGRRVHGPELEAAALQVEGVEYLEGLELAGWDAATAQWVPSGGRPIQLQPWEVPQLDAITVVEGPPLPAGAALEPPEPPAIPVPVPTLREEC